MTSRHRCGNLQKRVASETSLWSQSKDGNTIPLQAGCDYHGPRLEDVRSFNFVTENIWKVPTMLRTSRAAVSAAFWAMSAWCLIQTAAVSDECKLPELPRSDSEIVTTPLILKEGGTPENPAVFDGKGMVIDLGIDVTDDSWERQGDLWISKSRLRGREAQKAGNFPGLFIDELPLTIPRDLEAEKMCPDRRGQCYVAPENLKPGEMGYAEDGSFYFRWPTRKTPGTGRVILPPKPGVSCVTVACSHIIVKNIVARHASNDGFNIHNKWVGIRLENVKAFSNCDEGISAHDDVQMDVVNAEVAWNGSTAGGIADVNRCTTTYRNCCIHDNLGAAFYFSGRHHTVRDVVIYNQSQDFRVSESTIVVKEGIDWRR